MNLTAAKTLNENLTLLPKGDQPFALDLLNTLKSKGSLSEKQWYWVEKLASTAEVAGVPDFTMDADDQPAASAAGLAPILGLFDKASKYLKFPKVTLQFGETTIQLAMSGKASSRPGSISITDGGGYGNSIWYGRINTDGSWEPSKKLKDAMKDDLTSILAKLALDPQGTVSAFGCTTGKCAFCMAALNDKRSVEAGYGKVCAQRWGLPWGTVKAGPLAVKM